MSRSRFYALVVFIGFASMTMMPGVSASTAKGIVKSSDGKPMEGVVISAKANGKSITTSVYSDKSGRYSFPMLDSGQYTVWAQAIGFDADRATLTLITGKDIDKKFTLRPAKDFSSQLTGSEWMASLPENTPQDRRAKKLLGINCDTCHTLGFVLQNRFSATGWRAILNFMEKTNGLGVFSDDYFAQASSKPDVDPYIYNYKDELIDYLTKVRGPASAALNYKVFPRPTGDATQIVVTEYDVPPGHLPDYQIVESGSDWSMGTPSHYESRAVHDVVLDHEGNAWFGDGTSPKRTLGKLDPKTGKVADYVELDKRGLPVAVHDLITDRSGDIWFSNLSDASTDKIDPRTGKFQHFPWPESNHADVCCLVNVDSKGNVWNAAGGKSLAASDPATGVGYHNAIPDPLNPGGALELNPTTGKYTLHKSLRPAIGYYGAIPDAADNIWFTQPGYDRIDVIDAETGKTSEVPLGEDNSEPLNEKDRKLIAAYTASSLTGPPGHKGPRRGGADLKGNTVWYGESQGNQLAKIDIHTKQVKEYPMPYPNVFPYGIVVDNDHMVWVTSLNSDRLFKFNPSTEKFTIYRLPTLGTDARFITIDNNTNPFSLWVAYWGTSKVAHIQFRTSASTENN